MQKVRVPFASRSTLPQSTRQCIAVVIPAYRVSRFILSVLAKLGSEVDHVVVVDDCCPDGSGMLVRRQCHDPRVHVVFHEVNRGVGGATLTGYRHALALGADVIVKLDGDGQMNPALIPSLLAPVLAGDCLYAKGNRLHCRAAVAAMPPVRLAGNLALNLMSKAASGYWNISDPCNGFTCIHRRAARRLLAMPVSHSYFFESDVLYWLGRLGVAVRDVPMTAVYGQETSNVSVLRVLPEFLYKHLRNFSQRIAGRAARRVSASNIVRIYGVLAAVAMAMFVAWVPPMQSPDEQAHWYRAVALASGHWQPHLHGTTHTATTTATTAMAAGTNPSPEIEHHADPAEAPGLHRHVGAPLDPAATGLWLAYRDLAQHFHLHATASMHAQARALRWGAPATFVEFPGTAVYPPWFYLPAALGIAAGRALHVSVLTTYQLARLCNGGLAVLLMCWALGRCRRGRMLLFGVGLLPMTLFQFASVSQDALIIATTAVLLVSVAQARQTQAAAAAFARTVTCLCLLAPARSTLITFIGLLWPPLWPRTRRATPAFAATLIVALTGLWLWACLPMRRPPPIGVPDSLTPQLTFLSQHPSELVWIIVRTVQHEAGWWLKCMVGVLGWLDTVLPPFSYTCGYLALACAVSATLAEEHQLAASIRRCAGLTLLGHVGLTLFVFLLYWTPVGGPIIEGVQGRYGLTAALALALALPQVRRLRPWRGGLQRGVLVLSTITLLGLPHGLLKRYHRPHVPRVSKRLHHHEKGDAQQK